MSALIANLALLVCTAAILYVLVLLWPERLSFHGPYLRKKALWKTERMPLSELAKIDFHYEAVVGFTCVWEFTSVSGQVISLSSFRISRRLLKRLQAHIPGFSVAAFDQAFEAGDVSDSLELWRRPELRA